MNGPILPGENLIQMRKWRTNLTPFSTNLPTMTNTKASYNYTQLLSFFVRKERDNGERFWCTSSSVPDDVLEMIRECHDEEFPNDWRYNTIVNVLFDLKNNNEPGGDCGVDVYTSDLISWLTPSRMAYIDELQCEELIRPNATMEERIRAAQYHVTENMISIIRNFVGDNDDD